MTINGSMDAHLLDKRRDEGRKNFDLNEGIVRGVGCGIGTYTRCLLIVDPWYLPDWLLEKLTRPNEDGVTPAAIVPTGGDGIFYAECTGDGIAIECGS